MSLFNFFKKKEDPTLTVEQIIEIIKREYSEISSDDCEKIFDNLSEVCKLDSTNINDIKLVTVGQDSIVLEANNKIFKLTTLDYQTMSLSLYVSNSDYIQKPIIEKPLVIGNKRVTILSLNKLRTDKIRDYDVLDMYSKLRDDGYLWFDPLKSNLGRDESGNLLLFDYGQLIYIKDKDENFIRQELDSHRTMFQEFDDFYEKIHEEVKTK